MVRIFVFALITLQAQSKNTANVRFNGVSFELTGKKKCTAYILSLFLAPGSKIRAKGVRMHCPLEKKDFLESIIDSADIKLLPNNNYKIEAINPKLFSNSWNIDGILLSANTATSTAILKNGYTGKFKDFSFHSKENLQVKDFVFYIKNLIGSNKNWKINIEKSNISLDKKGFVDNFHAFSQEYHIDISRIDLYEKKNVAKDITISRIDLIAQAPTAEFDSKLAKIDFVDGIKVKMGNTLLESEFGCKQGDRLFLRKVSFIKDGKIMGRSPSGEFSIKNKSLLLNKGRVEW
jgi:hypothetical protein